MSEYVNHEVQLTPLDDFDMQIASNTDLDSIDWASLKEEDVMWEPWMDDIDWSGCYGPGADAVAPGAGSLPHKPTPECGDRNIAPRAHKRSFTCDSQGCKSKTFSSRTDLYRHERVHETKRWYPCPAKDCLRKGNKGFYREDKLRDHILAAHDNDTLFVCTDNHYSGRKCGGLLLTRDVMTIHAKQLYWYGLAKGLNKYRDCPLPKCPYRIYLGRKGASLDHLQAHLIDKHDVKGRANFTSRIRERGYDATTGEIICPICLGEAKFANHSSFCHHLFAAHFDGYAMGAFVPDGVRQYRRTILSLWPDFAVYPVWEDVKFH